MPYPRACILFLAIPRGAVVMNNLIFEEVSAEARLALDLTGP